jgi:CdiI immunity protein
MAHNHGVSDAMTKQDQRELHQFFAGYFHEDWPVDALNPDDVISSFIAAPHPAGELSRLADLVDSYACHLSNDETLEQALFMDLGCYYSPSVEGLSARIWLRHVASRLRGAR